MQGTGKAIKINRVGVIICNLSNIVSSTNASEYLTYLTLEQSESESGWHVSNSRVVDCLYLLCPFH